MKLHEHRQSRMNLIGRYGAGEIFINGERLTAPCIVSPGFLHSSWIANLEALTLASLEPAWTVEPRILCSARSGSGRRQRPASVLAARQVPGSHGAGRRLPNLQCAGPGRPFGSRIAVPLNERHFRRQCRLRRLCLHYAVSTNNHRGSHAFSYCRCICHCCNPCSLCAGLKELHSED